LLYGWPASQTVSLQRRLLLCGGGGWLGGVPRKDAAALRREGAHTGYLPVLRQTIPPCSVKCCRPDIFATSSFAARDLIASPYFAQNYAGVRWLAL
jgi:hypothetical protein